MSRTRTFVDAGLLIAAARGKDDVAGHAMGVLDDPDREFVSSDFVRLEVVPKPAFHKQHEELSFYEAFFAAVVEMVHSSHGLVASAEAEACRWGLSAIDALHVIAASEGRADELVTTEGRGKPLLRTTSVRVKTIRPL